MIELAKSADGRVRDMAIEWAIDLAANEEVLLRQALEIALRFAKELPLTIAWLERIVTVFDGHIAAAKRELIHATRPRP